MTRPADRRGRFAPALLLIAVAAACWAVTAWRMRGMDMGPGTDLGGLGWFATVWATMMSAMMLPSLVPAGLAHAEAAPRGGVAARVARTVLFACGYLLTWTGAGVLAYGVFHAVRSLDLSWLAWDEGGPYVAGGLILFAGVYELTPAKAACLRRCRDAGSLRRGRRPGSSGALLTGLEHGGVCVGSSWALMAALFAVGVMNVAWMVVVAGLVAIEKLLPWDGVAIGATALIVVALGLGVALAPDRVPGLTIPG